MPPNVDPRKTANNIVLNHIPVREAYHSLFDTYVNEYNARQIKSGHKERIINNYYDTIKHNTKKHTAYEIIVQIGSRNDGGAPKQAVDALITYYTGWSAANPNLKCIGAYIHQDEPGTVHLHLDYIPYAKCSRGMKMQNSLNQSLKSMGYISHGAKNTAQMAWEQSERERMRSICAEMGISLHKQGIGKKRHLTVGEYKEMQDNINEAKQNLAIALAEQIQSEFEADGIKQDLISKQAKINHLNETIKQQQSDIKKLEADADNQRSIITLLKQQSESEKNTLKMLRNTAKQQQSDKEQLSAEIAKLIMDKQKLQDTKQEIYKDIAAKRNEQNSIQSNLNEKKAELNEINEILVTENGNYIHMLDNFYWLIRDEYPEIADYAENEVRQHMFDPELDYNSADIEI